MQWTKTYNQKQHNVKDGMHREYQATEETIVTDICTLAYGHILTHTYSTLIHSDKVVLYYYYSLQSCVT